jgi:beta-galactosidase
MDSSVRLRLNTSGRPPQPGVKDVIFVYAQLTDAKGNPVTTNEVTVNFKLEGDAKLISPAQTLTRAGIASALIEIGSSLEGISISAQTGNLPPANLSIK